MSGDCDRDFRSATPLAFAMMMLVLILPRATQPVTIITISAFSLASLPARSSLPSLLLLSDKAPDGPTRWFGGLN